MRQGKYRYLKDLKNSKLGWGMGFAIAILKAYAPLTRILSSQC